MKLIAKKLNSRRGVSMLIALLFFFLCAMVSAVILGSAEANADRMNLSRQEEQEYLSLSSAVRLLRETIGGTNCSASESQKLYWCHTNPMVTDAHQDEIFVDEQMTLKNGDEKLRSFLAKQAYQMFRSQTHYKQPEPSPTMPVTVTIQGEDMKAVSVNMTMRDDYSLICELTVPDSPQAATLVFQTALQVTDPNKPLVTTNPSCIHRMTVSTEQPDGTFKEETIFRPFHIETHTLNTDIIWDSGKVLKGVVDVD